MNPPLSRIHTTDFTNLSGDEAKRRLSECLQKLQERERDVEIAAEIGKQLLEANQVLKTAYENLLSERANQEMLVGGHSHSSSNSPSQSVISTFGTPQKATPIQQRLLRPVSPGCSPSSRQLSISAASDNRSTKNTVVNDLMLSPSGRTSPMSATCTPNGKNKSTKNSLTEYIQTLEKQNMELQTQFTDVSDKLKRFRTNYKKEMEHRDDEIMALKHDLEKEKVEKLEWKDRHLGIQMELMQLRKEKRSGKFVEGREGSSLMSDEENALEIQLEDLQTQNVNLESRCHDLTEAVRLLDEELKMERERNSLARQTLDESRLSDTVLQQQEDAHRELKEKYEEQQNLIQRLLGMLHFAGVTCSPSEIAEIDVSCSKPGVANRNETSETIEKGINKAISKSTAKTAIYTEMDVAQNSTNTVRLRNRRHSWPLVVHPEEDLVMTQNDKKRLHPAPSSEFIAVTSRQTSTAKLFEEDQGRSPPQSNNVGETESVNSTPDSEESTEEVPSKDCTLYLASLLPLESNEDIDASSANDPMAPEPVAEPSLFEQSDSCARSTKTDHDNNDTDSNNGHCMDNMSLFESAVELRSMQSDPSFYYRFSSEMDILPGSLPQENTESKSNSLPGIDSMSSLGTDTNNPMIKLLIENWLRFLYGMVPLPGVAKDFAEKVVLRGISRVPGFKAFLTGPSSSPLSSLMDGQGTPSGIKLEELSRLFPSPVPADVMVRLRSMGYSDLAMELEKKDKK